jgi:hypothetical protein
VGPAISDGTVYQATADGVIALSAADGSARWSARLGAAPVAPPLVLEAGILVATEAPGLALLDLRGGGVVASRTLPGRPTAPTVSGGVLLVGTDHGMVATFDARTLAPRWRRYFRHAVTAPPLVVGRRVYVAVEDRSIRCLRLRSGRPIWSQRVGAVAMARLLHRDRYVYALCLDDDIYVIHRRNGHLLGRVRMDHRLSRDATVVGDHLFVTPQTEGSIVGLALPSLGVAGSYRLDSKGDWFTTSPVAVGDRVAVGWGRIKGRIVALDVAAAPKTAAAATPAATPAVPRSRPRGF